MQLRDAIQKRHSIRAYSKKAISWKQVAEILDSARFTPMAGNIITLRLVVVEEPEKINELAKASQQDFISDVPYLIVVCSDNTQLQRSYGDRAKIYSRQQAGAAIQNMLLTITELGLASCWIGSFDDFEVKKILVIPDDVDVEAILPIAHKSFIRELARKKPELRNILFFERYGKREKKPIKKPEAL